MATKVEKQQEMFSLIESWRTSGENQQVFCKSRGIAYSAFHYWYKKYRGVHDLAKPSGFIPVKIDKEGSGLPVAELIFPDGRRLNFYQAVEASFLRALLG